MNKPLSLVETIKIALDSFHLDRIARIDSEDFCPVIKKMSKESVKLGSGYSEEYLRSGILALKQYYAVALLDPNNSHAISDTLDPFWHTHILFSQQYERFCHGVVGVYMHHIPLNHDVVEQVDNVEALYDYTVMSAMQELFLFMDERFWPTELPRDRLVCMHYGSTINKERIYSEDIYRHALLPEDVNGMNRTFM